MFTRMLRMVGRIPRGKVATYGEIARAAGFPGAARQASWALHQSKGLPWHRVLGAKGKICLQGEAALQQRLLLDREGVKFVGPRVAMSQHEFRFSRQGRAK